MTYVKGKTCLFALTTRGYAPPQGGPGIRVHTFRHDPFVKSRFRRQIFPLDRKGPPARLKTRNSPFRQPLWTGKYIRCAWGTPPMANPPRPEKWRRRDPSRPFLRLPKVTQKRGFRRQFPGRSDGSFPAVPTAVSQRFRRRFRRRFPGGFDDGFRRFRRRFAGGAPP